MAANRKNTSLFSVFLRQIELFSRQDIFIRNLLSPLQENLSPQNCLVELWAEDRVLTSVIFKESDQWDSNQISLINKRVKRKISGGDSLVIQDVSQNDVLSKRDRQKLGSMGIRSCGIFPITDQDSHPVGSLCLFFGRKNAFSSHHRKIISVFTDVFSYLLSQSILYEDILELKQLVQSVVEFSTDAIVLTDELGKIIFISKQGARILQKRTSSLVGKYIFQLEVSKRSAIEDVFRTARRRKKLAEYEIQAIFPAGPRQLLLSISRVQLRRQNRKLYLWLFKDITSLRKAEGELQRKKGELEDFVYSVSHDLKSPLVSMQGYLSVLKEDLYNSLDDTQKYYFDRLEKNVNLMQRMIHDLLELSRIGRVDTGMTFQSVRKIVEAVLEEFQFMIERQGVSLEVPNRMPRLRCNGRYMKLVFANLISNALKFMGDQAHPKVVIGVRKQNDDYLFYVKDNGQGIEEKKQENLFRPFYRSKNAENIEGTGIGLAFVKQIIEFHGGRVWLESTPGEGTTVFFSVPGKY